MRLQIANQTTSEVKVIHALGDSVSPLPADRALALVARPARIAYDDHVAAVHALVAHVMRLVATKERVLAGHSLAVADHTLRNRHSFWICNRKECRADRARDVVYRPDYRMHKGSI